MPEDQSQYGQQQQPQVPQQYQPTQQPQTPQQYQPTQQPQQGPTPGYGGAQPQYPATYQGQQAPYQQQTQPQQMQQMPQQMPQQMSQQYGTPQQGGFVSEQPQPNYGQGWGGYQQPGSPYGQQPSGLWGGLPTGPQYGYDPLAKDAYICFGIGVLGLLLLYFGYVWGFFFCCAGIGAGVRGLYSRAKVCSILGIILCSIELIWSVLSFVASCAAVFD